MDGKKRKAAEAAIALSLEQADKRIKLLQDKVLPPYPHLLSVPSKYQTRSEYPNDHVQTFGFGSQREFEAMQYMTLITPTNGERGPILETRGDWEAEIAALAPNSRSNSGTPVPQKTFTNKVSFLDYKKNGMKAMSQSSTPNATASFGHSRNPSATSASVTMARGASFEGRAEVRTNGSLGQDKSTNADRGSSRIEQGSSQKLRTASNPEKSTQAVNGTHSIASTTSKPSQESRSGVHSSTRNPREEASQSTTEPLSGRSQRQDLTDSHRSSNSTSAKEPPPQKNSVQSSSRTSQAQSDGHRKDIVSAKLNTVKPAQDVLQNKEINKDVARKQQIERPRSNSNLSRRYSPPPAHTPSSQRSDPKRPSDSTNERPEKRLKTEGTGTPSGHARTPSNTVSTFPRKPDPSGLPPKPPASTHFAKSSTKPVQLDSASKRKLNGPQKMSPKPETPKDLPPLLSPLPANIESSPMSDPPPTSSLPSTVRKRNENTDDDRSRAPPSKRKANEELTSEKRRLKRSESPEVTGRRDKSGGIPRLLSPDLPSIIEKALDEVHEERKKHHQTVEERHEKARQPGAKGVARKTVKPKGARKRVSEASPDPDVESEHSDDEVAKVDTLIVKLRYKRKNIKNIDRILRLAPRPGSSGKSKAEQPTLKASALPKDDESSEDEIPLAKASATIKRPAASSKEEPPRSGRKTLEVPPASRTSQPAASSSKKTTPAPSTRHESPTPSAPSNKNLVTPKKSDAIKSVAMRRVDSSEAQSRTPQPAATSTPSSVSRSTMSDSRPTNPELIEKLRADQGKCGQLALKLKRKMDDILKQKIKPRPEISPKEKKLGVATGLEAMIVYMNSHTLVDRVFPSRSSEGWVQVLGLMNWLETESREIDVLHALLLQLSALSKEFLERSYVEQMSKDPKDAELVTKMCRNSLSRTNDWIEAEKSKGPLVPHGGTSILGPGSDIKDITQYAIGILTAYSRSEKTGWRKDSEFDTVKGTWV